LTPRSARREDAGRHPAGEGARISPRKGLRRSFASGSRGLALIGLVALLLGIVAWAAPGMTAGGAGPDGTSGTAPSAATSVVNLIVGAMWGAMAVVVIHIILTIRRRQDEEPEDLVGQPRRAWWLPWLAAAIILATVVGPIALIRGGSNLRDVPDSADATASLPPSEDVPPRPDPTTPSIWTILAVAAGAATAAFVIIRRATPPSDVERPPLPEEIVRAVDDSIHDIEREPDPRRAIIRAYARMEGALARSGIARRPSETPFEYLEAALRRLMVPAEPVRGLTELFEVARFSDRHLDASAKQRAIDYLLEVRFALAAEVA
jgi:hypothetical protein